MATFPSKLKPFFVENNELIRLGSIDDGGYVVPLKSIKNSKSLVSFGISDNWDFEKDFTKKANVNVYAYDHSIDKNFWLARFKKDFIKFLKLKRWRYKNNTYPNYLMFMKSFALYNNSQKTYQLLKDYLQPSKKNKFKRIRTKNIRWTN